ncbi:nucleotidyltransferase domain-containing protein [Clostridium sp. YIM B02515]|uniref:Nucleotidyltransferase domain-containing protein n=1 Tax=Clostridium rhizosphaerae TaxID=2803861 RepID=A0ABS1T9D1_9CLOT|nr:nucleotidyltransferase domain-containing protein [Clostridium rhizosphaerae]MBL4935697.1 nucleotidyltransferase domain-containing protein [Clostridium rhizosphaerae]
MNTLQIKEKLNSVEYDFLRRNKSLGKNIILLTTGGSHAYGTDTPKSDLDIRGITLNSAEEILTMNYNDKPIEDRPTDTVIYFLKQIVSLLLNCNPNTIEILGTKEEHLFICTEEGRLLRNNADLFLSKKAAASFGGYAIAQLRRLQNALARDSYPQKEKEKHILSSIQKQLLTLPERYKEITKGALNIYLDTSMKEDFDEEIFMDINLKHYPLRDFKNIYSDMNNVLKDYDKLNHRNSKKDELHLNKHAMHLIRLLIMGKEILEGKEVHTYREKEISLLMDIRNGSFNYNEIFEMVDKFDKEFKYAAENTILPDEPDYDSVQELLIQINKKVINTI